MKMDENGSFPNFSRLVPCLKIEQNWTHESLVPWIKNVHQENKKKNKRNDFHWKSCGPVLEELRLRKVRGDLHLACLVCIARKNVPDRDLPFTSFANDGGGWEMLGKTWDKKGLG